MNSLQTAVLIPAYNPETLLCRLVQELSAAVRMEPGELAALCGVTLLDVPKQQKPAKQTAAYGRNLGI